MITPIETPWEPDLWRRELRAALRNSRALLDYVGVDADSVEVGDFPVLVPRAFADRMQPGYAEDPLLRQVLATRDELENVEGFVKDPLAETDAFAAQPGLIQKYAGRALLITTSGCAINCRYCFRRHFPYQDHRQQGYTAALSALRADPSIEEVILSGGDPLLLDDDALSNLINALAQIPQLKRLRIHSRIPVVLPARITSRLTTLLHSCRLQPVLVIHANHANELNESTAAALLAARASGALLLNQSVLLAGVNDNVEAQVALAKKLFEQGVQPYYLHMPDRVAGTHHFYVDTPRAQQIYRLMQDRLPGYMVPKLVREIPGEASKSLLTS